MASKPRNLRRRRLVPEVLESRQLLAAHISELLIGDNAGFNNTDQVVELRAEPLTSFEQGTYLAVVDEDFVNIGEIRTLLDVSGLTTGENGFITFLQADSPHEVNPASTIVRSTSEGFLGLPDGIFTSDDIFGNGDLRDGGLVSAGYLLIQTDAAIDVDLDIDADNDGAIDEDILSQWNILDSISVHPFVGGGEVSYSAVLFDEGTSQTDTGLDLENTIVVPVEGFGYVARVGESQGSTAQDWMGGEIREIDDDEGNPTDKYEMDVSLFGIAEPYAYSGVDLNHFGEGNFFGGIRGRLTVPVEGPGDGEPGDGEPGDGMDGDTSPDVAPRSNVVVLADTNGNNVRDELSFVVDPDEFRERSDITDPNSDGQPLTNAFPGVTITDWAVNSFPSQTVTSELERDNNFNVGNRIFATGGIDWFTSGGRLRFDFFEPVRTVSIDALGFRFGSSIVYGQLDAYDAEGNLIASATSFPLPPNSRRTISVSLEDERIVRVDAYARTTFDDNRSASPFGRFDRMTYSRREQVTTTDEDGRFEFQHLMPGDYQVVAFDGERLTNGGSATINRFETIDLELLSRQNEPPVTEDATFNVSEIAGPGTILGSLTASDVNEQPLRFEFATPDTFGLVIRPDTGEVVVGENSSLDFETNASLELPFTVTDPLGGQATGTVFVGVDDANDTPDLTVEAIDLSEATEVGTVVGTAVGSDQDTGQTVRFEIIGGGAQGFLTIDESTGELTLSSPLDFETNPGPFALAVRATDDALAPGSTIVVTEVRVLDANDAPRIISDRQINVSDAARPGDQIGLVLATDQDENSSQRRFEIEGGSGSELFRINRESGDLYVADGVDLTSFGGTSVELDVAATDFGEPVEIGRATLTIVIADENQAPVFGTIAPMSVAEDAAAGTVVGVAAATDIDGDTLRYRIVGGTGRNHFTVNSETGEIQVSQNAELDFETHPSLTLLITAIDDNEIPLTRTIETTVTVTDVSESPVIDGESVSPPAATVGRRFEFALPDGIARRPNGETDGVALELVSGSIPSWLRFNPATKSFAGIPTSIRLGSIDVTIRATIDGNTADAGQFTFQVDVGGSDNLLVNTESSADVNGDDRITPVDAIEVINFIRRRGSSIDITGSERFDGFYDVSGDRRVSPADALGVINQIRRNRNAPDTEPNVIEPGVIDALDESTTKRNSSQTLDSAIAELYSENGLF